jgi:hypothetical protein
VELPIWRLREEPPAAEVMGVSESLKTGLRTMTYVRYDSARVSQLEPGVREGLIQALTCKILGERFGVVISHLNVVTNGEEEALVIS